MIYNSLDSIPIIIFFKIAESGDFSLLSNEDSDIEKLEEIWLDLIKQHEERQNTKETDKFFKMQLEIAALEVEYEFVSGAIYSLGFEKNDELIEMLKKFRFIVRTDSTENYYNDLEFIQRASKSFELKMNHIKSMMPKADESKEKNNKFSIYDTMASYTRIMGYDFDYETVSYSKFYAIQKQVHLKIESEIKNAQKNKLT